MKRALLSVLVGAGGLIGCAGGGYVYYAPAAPPPVRVEAFGAAPGPGYVWINGYWSYGGGGYAWVPGRWERPPHRGAAWVAGRWERKSNRWAYRAGHWR
jgi:hypothetical protein